MTIKLDFTQQSVVVKCNECPWWSGFGFDKAEAWSVGARHEGQFHSAATQARDALRMQHHRAS